MPANSRFALCFVEVINVDYDAETVTGQALKSLALPPTKGWPVPAVSAIAAVEKEIVHFEDSLGLHDRCIE